MRPPACPPARLLAWWEDRRITIGFNKYFDNKPSRFIIYVHVPFVFFKTAVPDLVINVEELQNHVQIDAIWLQYLQCAYEENCLAQSAKQHWAEHKSSHIRRLLRFNTQVENRGLAPFRPHVPQTAWQFHTCHNHYHSMETFSSYDLLSKYFLVVGIIELLENSWMIRLVIFIKYDLSSEYFLVVGKIELF